MLLGKRVLGEEGAAKEAAAYGGQAVTAVRLGPRVLGQAAPSEAAVPAKKARPREVRSANRVTAPKAPVEAAAAPAPKKEPGPKDEGMGYSEGDVESMLNADPNLWDVILDAEAVRPEGPRAAVAAMLLSASERATDKPIPAALITYLETLVPKAN